MQNSQLKTFQSKFIRFLIKAILIFIICLPVWSTLMDDYTGLLVSAGNSFFGKYESAYDNRFFEPYGGDIIIRQNISFRNAQNGLMQGNAFRHLVSGALVQFNLFLWIPLILAAPIGSPGRKALYLFFGIIFIFAGQVLSLYFHALSSKASTLLMLSENGAYRLNSLTFYLQKWGVGFYTRIGDKALPILLWFILAGKYMLSDSKTGFAGRLADRPKKRLSFSPSHKAKPQAR